jgi:hypothetical protein
MDDFPQLDIKPHLEEPVNQSIETHISSPIGFIVNDHFHAT